MAKEMDRLYHTARVWCAASGNAIETSAHLVMAMVVYFSWLWNMTQITHTVQGCICQLAGSVKWNTENESLIRNFPSFQCLALNVT